MAKLLNNPFVRFFTTSGTLAGLSGGKLYTYTAGGLVPKACYTDNTEGTAHDNPIIMNSNGIPEKSGAVASIWLATGAYKFVLTDSDDNVIQTIDNVTTTGADSNITIENSDPSLTITDTDGTLSHVMGVSADTLNMTESGGSKEYMSVTGSVATFGYDSGGSTVIRGTSGGITFNDEIKFASNGEFEYCVMYQHETENTITIDTQDVFVKVTGLSAGLASANGAVSSSAITVPAGKYKVDYSITLRSGSGSINAAASVFVNGVEQTATSTRMYLTAANLFQCFSGHGVIDVTDAAHEIDLRVKNITDTTNFNKTDVNFTVHQLGAT